MPEEQPQTKSNMKRISPFIVDVVILVGFYLSLRSASQVSFISDTLLVVAAPLTLFLLAAFFYLFYFLFLTSDKRRKSISKVWAKRKQIQNRVVRLLFNSVLSLAIFLFGLIHFVVYFIVLVMGPTIELDQHFEESSLTGLVYVIVGAITLSVVLFSIIYGYVAGGPDDSKDEVKEHQKKMIRLMKNNPPLASALLSGASVIMPVYTFWVYLSYLSYVSFSAIKTLAQETRQRLYQFMQLVFGFLLIVIFQFETYAQVTEFDSFAVQRVLSIFLLLYLPLKLLMVIVDEQHRRISVELIWSGCFFLAQLLIIYSVL